MNRIAVALLCLSATVSFAADRPNILWIVAEDMGPEIACYGTKEVETPNIDRLAAAGVRYTRAYTTAPVCSASRSAFMTGMYQTTIGAHHHRSHRDDGYALPENVRVLPDWLRSANIFAANIVQCPPEMGIKGTGKTDWNFTHAGKPFDSSDWNDLKSHQPFVAQFNFIETHRQGRKEKGTVWPHPRKADPAKVEIPPYYPDHPITREDWAGYLDSVADLDGKIGKILERLKVDGLEDDTTVIFSADHGHAHVRGKQFCYEEGLHIPLVIRWAKNFPAPKQVVAGTVSDQLISAIDLAPTILSIMGSSKPAGMQGRVFLGDNAEPARDFVFSARDRCDETVARFRTVRDARYRYIKNFMPERPFLQSNDYKERSYPVWNLVKQLNAEGKLTPAQAVLAAPTMPAEELYDLDADPYEVRNLAQSASPADQAALVRLRGVLESWIEETNDQGRTPEPPEVAAAKGLTKPGANPNVSAVKDGSEQPKRKSKKQ